MQSIVTSKKNGADDQFEGTNAIVLQEAGVVSLHIGPEEVARFDQVGQDLVLLLKDGSKILIKNFFVQYEDNVRSDLVFIDENGVTWWAQYQEPWELFEIAEIEREFIAVPFAAPLAAMFAIGGALEVWF